MSFQEDNARFGDELARMIDAGVPVKEAAVTVGVPRQRCYAILRAINATVSGRRAARISLGLDAGPWTQTPSEVIVGQTV